MARRLTWDRVTTGTNYIIASGDVGKIIDMDISGNGSVTMPSGVAQAAMPTGARIEVMNGGTGIIQLTSQTSVNIRSQGGKLRLSGQYAMCTLTKRNSSEWIADGNLIV